VGIEEKIDDVVGVQKWRKEGGVELEGGSSNDTARGVGKKGSWTNDGGRLGDFNELQKMAVIAKNHVGALEEHLEVFESLKC
jgi:hypothetical protein